MKNIHRIKTSLLFIVMTAVFLTGCGEASAPEEVAENYIKARFNQDIGTMKKLASFEMKKWINENEGQIKSAQIMLLNNLKQRGLSKGDIKELINNTKASPAEYAYLSGGERYAIVHVRGIVNYRITLNEEKEGVWRVSTVQQ